MPRSRVSHFNRDVHLRDTKALLPPVKGGYLHLHLGRAPTYSPQSHHSHSLLGAPWKKQLLCILRRFRVKIFKSWESKLHSLLLLPLNSSGWDHNFPLREKMGEAVRSLGQRMKCTMMGKAGKTTPPHKREVTKQSGVRTQQHHSRCQGIVLAGTSDKML